MMHNRVLTKIDPDTERQRAVKQCLSLRRSGYSSAH